MPTGDPKDFADLHLFFSSTTGPWPPNNPLGMQVMAYACPFPEFVPDGNQRPVEVSPYNSFVPAPIDALLEVVKAQQATVTELVGMLKALLERERVSSRAEKTGETPAI